MNSIPMSIKSKRKIIKGCRQWPMLTNKEKETEEAEIKNVKLNRTHGIKNKLVEDLELVLDSNCKKKVYLNADSPSVSHRILSENDKSKRRFKLPKTENSEICIDEFINTDDRNKNVGNIAKCNINPTEILLRQSVEVVNEKPTLPIIRWNAINKTLKRIYYVVDTNILLDFRDLLDDISGKVCDSYQLTIIIPYSAIIELDGLKKSNKVVASKVQDTIKWCNKHIEADISWIKGQSYMHYIEANKQCEGQDADGQIRNCALLYLKTKKHVALITNDINLKNRAILCGLKAYNIEQLYAMLEDVSFVVGNLVVDMKTLPSSPNRLASNHSDDQVNSDINLSSYLNQIRTSIAQSLGDILKAAMIHTYGDLWEKIIFIKPPWTSRSVLKCFRKHWIAVFIDKFPNRIQSSLECIWSDLEHIPVLPTFAEVEKLAKNVVELYDNFDRTDYARFVKRFQVIKDSQKEDENQLDKCHIVNMALNDIGKYSYAIFLHNKKYINDLSKDELNKGNVLLVINNLTNLQTTLVSLGYILLRFAATPMLSGYSDIQTQVKNFWKSAHCCEKDVAINFDQYRSYFSTDESKEFLQHYISDLEDIINNIRITLLNYEKL